MKYNKNIFCEDIAIGYESLELSPEAQRYLDCLLYTSPSPRD